MKKYFNVAGNVFSVEMDENMPVWKEMMQYAPFATEDVDNPVFTLRVVEKETFPTSDDLSIEMNQDDDGSQIIAGKMSGKPYFEFLLWGKRAARMIADDNYSTATVTLENEALFGVNNALMVMYALSTACKQTLLFHSSVVSKDGKAYMFLGISGTGKSTHSSLWLKHIKGTELVNDDNPVVRRMPDGFYVFGSPWSGKTPCYRNVCYPLGGLVQLSQAPYNAIKRLRPIQAYASLVPSISGKRWDKTVAEGLHQSENLLVSEVPVWHLECLPDEEAAQVCYRQVSGNNEQ